MRCCYSTNLPILWMKNLGVALDCKINLQDIHLIPNQIKPQQPYKIAGKKRMHWVFTIMSNLFTTSTDLVPKRNRNKLGQLSSLFYLDITEAMLTS